METPKPLTEKEIIDIGKRFWKMRADYDAWGSINDLDQSWIIANFGNLIDEFKRLRAGPTQARENILMDALIDLRESIDNRYPHGNASPKTWKIIIEKAIKQADTAKGIE